MASVAESVRREDEQTLFEDRLMSLGVLVKFKFSNDVLVHSLHN